MELKPDRLERQLAGEPLRPVYLVAGGEPLLVQEAADAIRARARVEGYGEREVYEAEANFNWDTLALGMASMSLFASRRLFDLRLPSGKPGKEGAEALLKFCSQTPPDTVLLVTAQEWSRSHGGKWSEAIARLGHLVPIYPLKAHELGDWLQRRLRSRGLVASPDAVQRLADCVEGNLLAAAQEVDKLALLVGGAGSPAIDLPRMEQLVADSSRFDVFKLVDAALGGESARLLRMLSGLRAEGQHPAALVPILAKEVLVLGSLARAAERGGVMAALRDARVWESKQPIYRRALERHPAPRWDRFLAECGRVELSAKGRGDGDPWLQLERLLLALAEPRARTLLAS